MVHQRRSEGTLTPQRVGPIILRNQARRRHPLRFGLLRTTGRGSRREAQLRRRRPVYGAGPPSSPRVPRRLGASLRQLMKFCTPERAGPGQGLRGRVMETPVPMTALELRSLPKKTRGRRGNFAHGQIYPALRDAQRHPDQPQSRHPPLGNGNGSSPPLRPIIHYHRYPSPLLRHPQSKLSQ